MKRTIKSKMRFIFKHFYVVILCMIVSGMLSIIVLSRMPKYYESRSIILIEDNKEYNYQNYKTYTSYIKNSNLIKSLSYTYEKVDSKNININLIDNTKLVEVNVKNEDILVATDMNNVLTEIYKEQIKEIYPEMKLYTTLPAQIINYHMVDSDKYIVLFLGIGLFIGVIILWIYSSDYIGIRNHKELSKFLKIKTLGIVPSENSVIFERNNKIYDTKLKIINAPDSIISESYRMIRTNLDYLNLKIINFTSTSIGEGKSETISNIAVSFALMGKHVLLIDCDLRKPRIHRNFKLNRSLGLTDVICYNRLEEYYNIIQEFKIKNTNYHLDILTAGSKVVNPSEMLSSNRFKKLLNLLKEEYDLILIDCPPVSLMTDATIVSRIADGTVYVVEYDRINYSVIDNGIESLKNVDVNVLGAIMTKVNINRQKKLYGSKYEYYRDYIS